MTQSKESIPRRVKFARSSDFRRALKQRVDAYFEETGLTHKDQPAIYVKAFVLLATVIGSYCVLVFTDVSVWFKAVAAITFGLAGAGIGFNVMHDAGHRAMSEKGWVNKAFFYTLDFLGGSSYFWGVKHNQLHHTYANIDGHDDDIDMGALARLSPEQRRRSFHRLQHLYVWPLYGLIVPKWQFMDDFRTWITGRIGDREIPRPKGTDAAALVIGKIWFFTMFFVVPAFFYPISWIIAFYLLASWVQGFTMSVVFQLAHCLEEAEFPVADDDHRMPTDWASHQVETTVDFARDSKLLTWYAGGLNFQVEHHLFPKISHIHYPQLSRIVEETCAEFGLDYKVQPSFWSGLRSHFRHLREMGRPVVAA
jgi:linoleoyl-CoA desaturase